MGRELLKLWCSNMSGLQTIYAYKYGQHNIYSLSPSQPITKHISNMFNLI